MALKITKGIEAVMLGLLTDMGDTPSPVFIGPWPHGGQSDWCERGASIAKFLRDNSEWQWTFDADRNMIVPSDD